MEIKDVLGLGKMVPVDKLIDTVSKAFGAITKPYLDRRDVDTDAYRIEKIAEAKAKALKIMAGAVSQNSDTVGKLSYSDNGITIESATQKQNLEQISNPSLEQRAAARISFQETRNQLNIESIVGIAAEELKSEETVTNDPVNDDWTSRFFKYAEDVSDDGMQAIWGRILAGEVKKPNTYSLRTLEVLRNLSKQEAEILLKAADLALESQGEKFIYKSEDNEFVENLGLNFMDITSLKEAGLIHNSETLGYTLSANEEDTLEIIFSKEKVIIVERPASSAEKSIPIYLFTKAGSQLLNLINSATPIDYLNSFAKSLSDDINLVKYAPIKERKENQMSYEHPLLPFPMPKEEQEGDERSENL